MANIFRPVRASESTINGMGYNEGYVYFAKDSGKIFLDVDNERRTMGGSGVSVFYAKDTNVKENMASGYYTLSAECLMDESAQPHEEDLILNIPDGGFYRVVENDGYTLTCVRIAVSGSGSGGGSGSGDGGGSSAASVTLTRVTAAEPPAVFVYGKSYPISFKATSTVDRFCTVVLSIYQADGTLVSSSTPLRVTSGSTFELDFGLALPKGSNYTIMVEASSDNAIGTSRLKYGYRSTLELGIAENPDFNPRQVFGINNPCSLGYVVKGSSGIKREAIVYIDGNLFASQDIAANVSDGTKQTIKLDSVSEDSSVLISHGAHQVAVKITTELNGETVESDSLEYELAWEQDGVKDAIIWCPWGYPETLVQYETLNIDYLVYQPGVTSSLEVKFLNNGELLMTRSLTYNASSYHTWNIIDYVVGNNVYAITCGNAKKTFEILVTEDTSRDMGIITSGLVLNLDSAGRSNSEYPSSRSVWKSSNTTSDGNVTLKNFNWYNNGWLSDSDGTSFLRVSNGASVSIPFNTLSGGILTSVKNIETPISLEFRFRVRNINRYDTLITTIEEDDHPKRVITGDKAWGKLYGAAGFCLGTQEAFIASTGTVASARYREDEIVTVSFVVDQKSEKYPLLYVYINGILTSVERYDINNDSFISGSNNFEITSDYCDVDIYKIRVYKGNKLQPENVVQNYIADLKDVAEYDANQITENDANSIPTIALEKLEEYNKNHPDATTIPYMIIESKDHQLPYVKGGKKVVNITFKNPALDYAYEQGLIDGKTYLKSAPSFEYTQNFELESAKGSLNVQGTSSQGYPRRNFKWSAKQADAKWKYTNGPLVGQPIYEYDEEASAAKGKNVYVGAEYEGETYTKYRLDSEIGETTFCFKADFMESSGSYNTGFASFVKTTYDKHPLQDYGLREADTSKYRTTVYGFPMLVFEKDSEGKINFVGRYNFNLDKSADSTYGFTDSHDSFIKDEEGNALPFEEVAECWELTDNQGSYCSFKTPGFDTVGGTTYEQVNLTEASYTPNIYYIQTGFGGGSANEYTLATGDFESAVVYYKKNEGTLNILGYFEYRYHVDADDIDDCIDGVGDFATATQTQKNQYLLEKYKNLQNLYEWLNSTYTALATGEALPEPVTLGDIQYSTDTAAYRLAKFQYEFRDHFDLDYCTNYAVMTEFFHLYDSRGKNMMLATWGPQKEGGNYIWYPIFYDMDTQLGINNSGTPTWDYDAEPTNNDDFSTADSVLWDNFYQFFLDNIKKMYDSLRKNNKLTLTQVNAYYNSYPIPAYPEYDSWKDILADSNSEARRKEIISYARIGKKPLMIYNVDEYFKYIAPSITGYVNTKGETAYDNGVYFYALQGSRELSRYLYLRNRFNFIDSMWQAGSYSVESMKQGFQMRANANLGGKTSDRFLIATEDHPAGTTIEDSGVIYTYTEEQNDLDANYAFKGVRTFLTTYVRPFWDEKPQVAVKCDGITAVDSSLVESIDEAGVSNLFSMRSTPNSSQQLFYIGGPEYIADLGDFSNKYLDQFTASNLIRLESLKLGSDAIVNGIKYKNSALLSFDLGDTAGSATEKPLLKSILLNGVDSVASNFDVSGSEKLQELRALRTNFTGFTLADGVQVKTLHLPASISFLSLTEPTSLTKILESPYDDPENLIGPREGLYIEGLTDKTTFGADDLTHINTYQVIGGVLGYQTYSLLDKLVKIKKNMIAKGESLESGYSNSLDIKLTGVEWSPYVQVVYGEPYNASKTYYQDNQHFGLIKYIGGQENWEFNTSNGYIYEYTENENEDMITDLNIFDTFIETHNHYLETNDVIDNYFRDNSGYATTLPEITGFIYVNNVDTINEAELANKYEASFPNLKFFAKNVNQSYSTRFVSLVDGEETIVEANRYDVPEDGSTIYVKYPESVPTRFNYDFVGWSLDPEGSVLSREEIEALTFSNDQKEYIFYAIWVITTWQVTFKNYANNGTQVWDEWITAIGVDAGQKLYDPQLIPASPLEPSLSLEERYRFVGWTTDKTKTHFEDVDLAEKAAVDLTLITSENTDRIFYAVYVLEDVHTTPIDSSYLTIVGLQSDGTLSKTATASATYTLGESTITIPDGGVILKPKDGVTLSGKITLPTEFTINGQTYPVYRVTGFDGQAAMTKGSDFSNLTHIFWSGPDHLMAVSSASTQVGAFSNLGNLQYIELPPTLQVLDAYALTQDNLSDSGLGSGEFDLYAASNLKIMFRSSFNGVNATRIHIPGTVEAMGDLACAYHTSQKETLVIGGPGDPSQLNFASTSAFTQNGPYYFSSVQVYYDGREESKTRIEDILQSQSGMLSADAVIEYLTA